MIGELSPEQFLIFHSVIASRLRVRHGAAWRGVAWRMIERVEFPGRNYSQTVRLEAVAIPG